MSITYSFEIVAVNKPAKTMEVVYTSEGRQTMRIGARLPYENELISDVIAMFAPVAYWLEQDIPVQDVVVGLSGAVTLEVAKPNFQKMVDSLESVKANKKSELFASREAFERSGVFLDGVQFDSDKGEQAALLATLEAMRSGTISAIEWKTSEGLFVMLDAAKIVSLLTAIAFHMQAAVATEKTLRALVDTAQNKEAVNAITWPA